ncbi:DUF4097 family beta strand repeat-containing protein [Chryseolinea lacunae]|uniref:DUF4097 family beta strand repeat protein n=1 Tax=Chryseolinea lacunae TaxID=2801331 RepID=A0ABS1KPS4_9BACT|nr:DUF4097 family beta strand repeat-containing protein [Chryseolinea lacunae]MBL0741257.1 DUF4097 family beta strand repeat protein [Chryseolinea lacunae]
MKKQLIIAISSITLGLMLIATSIAWSQTSNQFTVPLTDPGKKGKLRAHINYGSITVKGTARKDILVKYSGEADEDKGGATKDGLRRVGGSGMDLEVTENENNVKVSSDSWSHKMSLEIEVPSGMDLDVKTYNDGDLVVNNIQGTIELTNYNGEITATSISGSVVATTYNGTIKVTFDKVTEGTPMSYSTYNGDVDLTFPATVKATFKMKTEQGDIYSGFDVNFQSTGPVQKKDTKSGVYKIVIDEWKRGDVNGGGPEVTIKNYNGDIFLRKK